MKYPRIFCINIILFNEGPVPIKDMQTPPPSLRSGHIYMKPIFFYYQNLFRSI